MLDHTEHLRHRSGMDGDPFADILTLTSARCVRIGTLKAEGTWALRFPPPQKVKLTAVVKGTCWLAVDGERAPLQLQTGDVFMVPAERSYVLASDLKAPEIDGLALFTKATDNVGTIGDGKDFFAVGGHVALDADRGGLLADVLAPLIHIDASSSEASTIRWLLDQLVKEVTANRPGAVLASKHLAQLLFVQSIRSYLAASTPLTTGWLRALNDERIAPALRPMHGEPGRAWQLGELAKQLGMSRTTLPCASRLMPVSPLSRTCRTCECALRSKRCVKARRRSPSWPSPWATRRTAHSATRSNEEGSMGVYDRVGNDVSRRRYRAFVLEQGVHRRRAPRVRPDARDPGPDRRDGFVEPVLVAPRHDDDGAVLDELLRDRQADPLRAAGDNGDLSIE